MVHCGQQLIIFTTMQLPFPFLYTSLYLHWLEGAAWNYASLQSELGRGLCRRNTATLLNEKDNEESHTATSAPGTMDSIYHTYGSRCI